MTEKSMRERLARRLIEHCRLPHGPTFDELGDVDQRRVLLTIDALLAELREPDEAMKSAAVQEFQRWLKPVEEIEAGRDLYLEASWRAMIDAIKESS